MTATLYSKRLNPRVVLEELEDRVEMQAQVARVATNLLTVNPARAEIQVSRAPPEQPVDREPVGNQRVIRPDTGSPFYSELRGLLLKAFGPASLLQPLLATGISGLAGYHA